MSVLLHQHLLKQSPQRLAELLAIPESELKVEFERGIGSRHADAVISWGKTIMAIECKASGQADWVAMAARRAKDYAHALGKVTIPVVVVPYMGEVGKWLCEEAGVAWFDLSGNARIAGPGFRAQIEGNPNQFKRPGRPRNLLAPKSDCIARWLLIKRDQSLTQRELARVSGLDGGFYQPGHMQTKKTIAKE